MKLINVFFLGVLISSCSCSNSIQKDTQKRINAHKEFMRSLSFYGQISNKVLCEKCEFNKYQLVIGLTKTTPGEINLGDRSFQPYYFFDTANQIYLSVPKYLYEAAQKGMNIEKQPGSDLIVNGSVYKFLSDKKYEWLAP